jgi:hypothetical protein
MLRIFREKLCSEKTTLAKVKAFEPLGGQKNGRPNILGTQGLDEGGWVLKILTGFWHAVCCISLT